MFVSTADDPAMAEHGSPLPGVTIQLLDQSGHVIHTATTNQAGEYVFSDLPDGYFGIREIQPAAVADGFARAGDGGGSVLGRNLIADVPLTFGRQLTGYDFWELPLGTTPGENMPPGDRPVFPLSGNVTTNVLVPSVGVATRRASGPAPITPLATNDLTTADAAGNLLLALQPTPRPQRRFDGGGSGQLFANDRDSQPASEVVPSSDPLEVVWELARNDAHEMQHEPPDADGHDESEDSSPHDTSAEQAAHDLALEQLAAAETTPQEGEEVSK